MKVELHSITFEDDLLLTEIQLKSIDRLFDHSQLSRVVIHINSRKAAEISDHLLQFALDELSPALYQILTINDDILKQLDMQSNGGWTKQQLMKLQAVEASSADWVLMLDAKNHFVRSCGTQDLFSSGRAKINLRPLQPLWKVKINGSRKLFDLPNVRPGDRVLPTVTPFLMHTGSVRDMLAAHGDKIIECLSSARGTEFFIYGAYLEANQLVKELYSPQRARLCHTLFTVAPKTHEKVMALLNEIIDKKVPIFGLHRRRIPILLDAEKEKIRELWRPLELSKDYLAN